MQVLYLIGFTFFTLESIISIWVLEVRANSSFAMILFYYYLDSLIWQSRKSKLQFMNFHTSPHTQLLLLINFCCDITELPANFLRGNTVGEAPTLKEYIENKRDIYNRFNQCMRTDMQKLMNTLSMILIAWYSSKSVHLQRVYMHFRGHRWRQENADKTIF